MIKLIQEKHSLYLRITCAVCIAFFALVGMPAITSADKNEKMQYYDDKLTLLGEKRRTDRRETETRRAVGGSTDDSVFSIVWLPDTQTMAYNNPDALKTMGEWIKSSYQKFGVKCVIQTGDAVDNGFKKEQWDNFDLCYDQFRDILPYFGVAGNHDIGVKRQDYDAYLARANVRTIPCAYSYEAGKGAYRILTVNGEKFLVLGVGWAAEEQAVDWMNAVLRLHPDMVAILLLHSYINADGSYTNPGRIVFEEVVRKNANVRLILSGHVRGTGVRKEMLDDDGDDIQERSVTALLCNYQHYGDNCGQLRILTFDLTRRSLEVQTYSPVTKKYYEDSFFNSSIFTIQQAF